MIEERPALELALAPEANIICFRYVGNGSSASASDGAPALDQLNAALRQEMLEDGKFYLVQTQLRGRQYLRTTLMNVFTTEAVLGELLNEVEAAGERISYQLA